MLKKNNIQLRLKVGRVLFEGRECVVKGGEHPTK